MIFDLVSVSRDFEVGRNVSCVESTTVSPAQAIPSEYHKRVELCLEP